MHEHEKDYLKGHGKHRPTDADGGHAPGRASRSGQLNAPKHAIASGLASPVQRKIGVGVGVGDSDPAPAATGSGKALPADVRAKMEGSFGADFSAVRIHEGPHVLAMGARAYAQANDLHFAPGEYQPDSTSGQELIGHELAHYRQQSEGRVQATTQAKGLAVNDDAGLEREADEMGAKAARGESVSRGGTSATAGAGATATVQRKVGDGGTSLIGHKVIEAGKARPWTIKSAQGAGATLQYEIDFGGMVQKWISAHDEAWSLHTEPEPTLSEAELALAAKIDAAMSGNPAGVISGYEANRVDMADIHAASQGAWSGGASDCVIVGGVGGGKVYLTHADRTSTALARRIIQNASTVYLASEAFSRGGQEAIKNGNVQEILAMIVQAGRTFRVFNAKQMAVEPNGNVFTSFPIPTPR